MRTPSSASALRAMDSHSESGGAAGKGKQQLQQPVSARKLAATLWEMNEMPSSKVKENGGGEFDERRLRREARARERERAAARSLHSGSLPPHLSDPSHSPVSEVCLLSNFGLVWFGGDLKFLFLFFWDFFLVLDDVELLMRK